MKYILKYKLFLFIIGILFLQSFSIVAADNTYTMGGSSNQLRIALSSGGKWNIYRETVGGNNTWVKQFYGDADVFTIKIGATSIRSTAMAIEDISATTSGVSQVVSKKYTGVYESNSFSVILNFNYNTSNPSYMTLQAIVGATAIPSGTSISLAYGFDAYVNGCDGGAAITVPDISYNTVDQSVNLSQAQVQGLRMIGGINSNYTGSLIAFFPMGKPFDRAYSACYTSAYSYQVINQATNSNLFKFGPYAVPSCSGGCSSNPWDNGIGVVYDNIVAGTTTDIRTGLSFTQDLDGELDYTWNGSKNLVANLGDNINLNLKYTSYNSETLPNVGFKVNLPGLKINSGGCTQSGFNSGNFGCVVGNEYYQLTNGNINSLGTGNITVPVQVTQCGQWSIDGDAISDMVRTLPLGTPAVLTVKSNVGLASTANIGICKGGSSIITVKLPNGVTPAHPITVALSYTGSTSAFTSLPTSVIIPAGQNSATFTIVSNASAADNSSLQVTLASTNQEFATINTAKTVAVNLYNTPTVTNTLNNQTICSGTLTSVISLTSSVTGATFTWTNTNRSIGLDVEGTGNIPAFTATNTTANPITATIRVTPTANGCEGTYKEYTITVNPTPTVSTVLNNLTYCNTSSSPAITLTSATVGTTFTWTNTNRSIGLDVEGTGNIPAFIATNTTANPITATIRVTPTANGCEGTYKEYTITVNPTPTVSTVLNNLTYCNTSSSPAITLTSATVGTTFTWTNTNRSIGLDVEGTGNIPAFIATNTTANPITATIRVTPTANGCEGTYKEYTITVNPTPTVSTVLNNLTYCNTSSSPAITLTSATVGTTFTWTNTNRSIGLDVEGTGNIPAFIATNTTANPITATIRVTPTANGCEGTYKEYTITVNPTPTVSTVLNNLTYCNTSSSPAITLTSATVGTTFTWTNTNRSIGLDVEGTGNIPAFIATNTTANPITATIRVTPTASGCEGTYKEYTITVRPVVVVGTITGNPYACEGDVPQTIKGIATIGGTGTFTYQWQQSINNTTWTNISGATGLDYTPGVLTQSTYFKRISIDANCGSFESNSFLITKVEAGVKFTWKSIAIDNNWNNPANWTNTGGLVDAVPTKCSDVHIPSVSNKYPALDENTMRGRFGDPVTDKIIFHFGGQVAYPHKLTYNKAFVQYNWGYYAGGSNEQPGSNLEGTASKMITRDKWYMLAAPLKKMASGDFALGGYPITWQSLYNAPHPSTGTLVEGDFSTPFSSNDIDLSTKNNALAVKVACYNSNIGYSDQRHLEGLQGILEIPYFENSTVANYHPGHVYNKIRKESRFYYFDEKTLQQLASPIGTLARGDEAYRFVFEDANTNKAPNIVVNGVETVPGYTHHVTSGTSNDKTVMIGNPFMATINSRLFFEANSTKLNKDAGYYMLTPTNQVWSRYEYKTENKVPALQAIVITLADGLTSADLLYPLEGTYALTEVSNQTRSVASLSDDSGSSLYIRATDGSDKTSDYAILNAEETGESSGISKMIYPASHSVTEAFIVSSDQEYNLIDFYNGKRTEVGLGIKSSNQKDVLTLEFENVESFKYATGFSPVLIDRYLNVEQDLSSNNVYRFNQRKTESERQYSDVNRFSLSLSSATSGIIDETNSDDLIRVTYLTSQLEVTCSLGLVQVDVYDLQGRYLHTSGNLTGAPVTYTKYLPLSRGVLYREG